MIKAICSILIGACALFPHVLHAGAPEVSLRPVARAETPIQMAQRPKAEPEQVAFLFGKKRREARKGKLCGIKGLQGEVVGKVQGRISGCGVASAVKVRAVSGVALSQGAVMDCDTAKALKSWVDNSVVPAVGRYGGGVAKLRVAAHYVCRTRNHKPGAKISEHGKGKAIDISVIYLKNGKEISVLRDWAKGKKGRILRQVHKGACGPFGTVLGPNSDPYHKDHFHFDTARYRSGPYCR